MSSTQIPHQDAGPAPPPPRTAAQTRTDARRLLRTCERALARPWVQWTAVVAGLLGAVAVAAAALVVGPLAQARPGTWWFDLPLDGLATGERIAAMNKVFYAGLATMTASWLVVGLGVRAGRWRVRWLWALGALWALPWLVAPVALSTDLYTYLAQGVVADAGLNPFTHGPSAVDQPDVLLERMSHMWLDTPSPYGPAVMGLTKLIAPLAAEHIVRAVVLLRLVALAGIALAAVSLPRIARHTGNSPTVAVWLGVVSPLMLASGVLSGHNDALMVGLIVAALAVATRPERFAPLAAVAIVTVATLVKAPAAVALGVLALGWARRAPRLRTGFARLGGAVLAVVATAAVVSVASGFGAGWLSLSGFATPFKGSPPFAPTHAVSLTLDALARMVGLEPSPDATFRVVRLVVQALVAVFGLLVLWRQPRLGDARTVGLLLAAAVVASPTVWPWYVIWPAVVLAACGFARSRPVWVAIVAGAVFLVRSDGGPGLLELPGIATIGVLTVGMVIATGVFSWRTLIQGRHRPLDQVTGT